MIAVAFVVAFALLPFVGIAIFMVIDCFWRDR
jgi:hypothetical protein